MNYIAEINAFNEWCEQHCLQMSSQFLWYKLMAKNNRLGWCEWMSIDNLELMGILKTRREATAIDTRDKLIEAGLVEYIKGKKGKFNSYKMVSLSNLKVQSVVNTAVNTEVQSVVNTAVNTVDINKQNKTKLNESNNNPLCPPQGNEGGKRKRVVKSDKPIKTQYAEFVSMTNDEYMSLVARLGEQGTVKCVEILDNYKGSSGKKYNSDYRAILSWVIKRYEEEQACSSTAQRTIAHKETTNERNNRMLDEYFSGGEAYDRGRIEVIAEYDVDEL